MSGFDPGWLALREPHDAAARCAALVERLPGAVPGRDDLVVVDLGCGTGANLRYLAPLLGSRQRWLLVDHDPALLAAADAALREWAHARRYRVGGHGDGLDISGTGLACRVEWRRLDLAADLASAGLDGADLVTASALLDLVSDDWLRELVARCRTARASVLLALSYDGRIGLDPPEPGDAQVRELVNRHQRRDKGFGPALGPEAAVRARQALAGAGYRVTGAAADWRLGADAHALQASLIEGWRAAAAAVAPGRAARVAGWAARRLAHVAAARSRLEVGHVDLVAVPH